MDSLDETYSLTVRLWNSQVTENLVVCVRAANFGRSQDGVGICTQGTLCEHLG